MSDATTATDPAEIVAAVEARARRIDTPCGDGTVAWRIWGEGEPVVLSHGASGAWSHWIRNIDVLARHRMVIAVDLPGHGDSAVPTEETHPAITAALAEGLRRILPDALPVDLVGFSFGGVIFAHLAAHYPELVKRLVLVGCGGLGTPHGHVDLLPARGLVGEERRAVLKHNLLGLMLHAPESVDDLAMHLLQVNARASRFTAAQHLVLPDRLLEALTDVRAQVDAIWGDNDRPHPDPHVQEAAIRRTHPAADFRVIAGAGHWTMYEQADAFNAALLDMLGHARAQ